MTDSLVYQYIWRDHSLPPSRGLLLTLSDNESIALIAFVTTLAALSQTRFWVISRFLLLRYAMPKLQLPDPDHPANHLSQTGAIRYLIQSKRLRRNQQIHSVPPWFGMVAIANIMIFLALGIILPWSLVGGIETPLVKSRKTNSCVGLEMRDDTAVKTANLADSFFKQCWYNLTDIPAPCDRMEEISSYRLPLHISRESECPFPGDVCQNQTQPVRLEHQYISPRLVGVNSRSQMRVSHRLICAPLKIEPFLLQSNITDVRAGVSFGNLTGLRGNSYKMGLYSTMLGTLNGPNHLSSEKSGRKAALNNRPYDLKIFPPEEERNSTERIYSIHADLRREDATVFVILLQAGRTYYDVPIEDPFFSAHDLYTPASATEPLYFPDYEATAIGCAEQYRLCFGERPELCLAWQPIDIEAWDMLKLYSALYEVGDIDSANDVFPVTSKLIRTACVHHYLIARRGTKALLASMWRRNELATNIDKTEQWIHELKVWFETSILTARFGFLELVKRKTPPRPDEDEMSKLFDGICDRVLFRSGDYTNFYFIWLMTAISTLTLLSLLSYGVTYTTFRHAGKGIATLSIGIFNLGKKAAGSCYQQYSALSNRLYNVSSSLHTHISNAKTQAIQIMNSWTNKMQNITPPSLSVFTRGFRTRSRTTTLNSNSGSRSRAGCRSAQSNQPQRPFPAVDPGPDVDLNDVQPRQDP